MTSPSGRNGECDEVLQPAATAPDAPALQRGSQLDCGQRVLICLAGHRLRRPHRRRHRRMASRPSSRGAEGRLEENPVRDEPANRPGPKAPNGERPEEGKPPAPAAPSPGAASVVQARPSRLGRTDPALRSCRLTLNAVVALNRARPRVSQVGFAFTFTAPARVHVTLARRVAGAGTHALATALPYSLTITATVRTATAAPDRSPRPGTRALPADAHARAGKRAVDRVPDRLTHGAAGSAGQGGRRLVSGDRSAGGSRAGAP